MLRLNLPQLAPFASHNASYHCFHVCSGESFSASTLIPNAGVYNAVFYAVNQQTKMPIQFRNLLVK